MRLRGNIDLHLDTDRRWYVVEQREFAPEERRIIGRPEGYVTHREASRWRRLYREVRALQVGKTSGRDGIHT
jgi:hypothetical protein